MHGKTSDDYNIIIITVGRHGVTVASDLGVSRRIIVVTGRNDWDQG